MINLLHFVQHVLVRTIIAYHASLHTHCRKNHPKICAKLCVMLVLTQVIVSVKNAIMIVKPAVVLVLIIASHAILANF